MKNKKPLILCLLAGPLLAMLAACSGSDDSVALPDTNDVRLRHVTIHQTETAQQEARQMATRATLSDDSDLKASWTAGDRLTYCNLSRINPITDETYSGQLTAASTATIAQFAGDVVCRAGDYLGVAYPASEFETNEQYTITLSGQDGTLATLAESYHYQYGRALVTQVSGQTAEATMQKMKSLLAVGKFSFVDRATGNPLALRRLEIAYGGDGSDAGTYPQTATVAVSYLTPQADVHAVAVPSALPLVVEGSGEVVYVALLPTAAERTYRFTATTDDGNTYKGTAKATLAEGDYVVATGLKLTKQ